MDTTTYHKPVLLTETLQALNLKQRGFYIDATFGGGGHSSAILQTDKTIKLAGIDWDKHAIEHAAPLQELYADRLELIWGSFAHLYKIIKKHKLPKADGILADFGTSQNQITQRDGFSIFADRPLDMRMSNSHFKTTATEIINYATEQELCEIFWKYGEERFAKQIVKKIIEERKKKKITTTGQLAQLIKSVVFSKTKVHPATRVFQALRIFVNQELENISAFLPVAFDALKPGGRLVCISFHSLEDRIVKQFVKDMVITGKGLEVSKKVIVATPEEISSNPSCRSAKLRVIEKK